MWSLFTSTCAPQQRRREVNLYLLRLILAEGFVSSRSSQKRSKNKHFLRYYPKTRGKALETDRTCETEPARQEPPQRIAFETKLSQCTAFATKPSQCIHCLRDKAFAMHSLPSRRSLRNREPWQQSLPRYVFPGKFQEKSSGDHLFGPLFHLWERQIGRAESGETKAGPGMG